MVDITRHLSYNDINLLKKNAKEKNGRNNKIENIERQSEERQK